MVYLSTPGSRGEINKDERDAGCDTFLSFIDGLVGLMNMHD
jgi:hypothetical protein